MNHVDHLNKFLLFFPKIPAHTKRDIDFKFWEIKSKVCIVQYLYNYKTKNLFHRFLEFKKCLTIQTYLKVF